MGKMLFGSEEKLECIQPVGLKGADEEPLCLAYKTTKTFFVAGVKLKDDGYVLRIIGGDSFYPMPEGDALAAMQHAGTLPATLPPYSIGFIEYAWGYSLWWIIGLVVVWERVASVLKKRRKREDDEAPLSVGAPILKTKHDQFIVDTVRPLLAANEQIEQQAYGFPEPTRFNGDLMPGKKAVYAALTNQRLFLIHARVGAFAPLFEKESLEEIPRARIAQVVSEDALLQFTLDDGTVKLLLVPRKQKQLSNQERFLRDVPKLFVAKPESMPEPAADRPTAGTRRG